MTSLELLNLVGLVMSLTFAALVEVPCVLVVLLVEAIRVGLTTSLVCVGLVTGGGALLTSLLLDRPRLKAVDPVVEGFLGDVLLVDPP